VRGGQGSCRAGRRRFSSIVTRDEVVEVAAFERVLFQREVQICPQVVDPELFRPQRFLSRLAVEEQDVGFDSLSLKDAARKTQQCMDVGLFLQITADRFASSTFEQHVVRQNHGSSTVLFQNREDVLQEVELLVKHPCISFII